MKHSYDIPRYSYILTVHQVINSGFGSIIPRKIQKAMLEGIFSLARAQLSDYVLNEKNPIGILRLEKLKRIFEEGKSLQLQFPAHDLGFWSEFDTLLNGIALNLV